MNRQPDCCLPGRERCRWSWHWRLSFAGCFSPLPGCRWWRRCKTDSPGWSRRTAADCTDRSRAADFTHLFFDFFRISTFFNNSFNFIRQFRADIACMVDNMGNGGDGDACLCCDFFDGHKTPPCWCGLSPSVPARQDLDLPQFCVSVF